MTNDTMNLGLRWSRVKRGARRRLVSWLRAAGVRVEVYHQARRGRLVVLGRMYEPHPPQGVGLN